MLNWDKSTPYQLLSSGFSIFFFFLFFPPPYGSGLEDLVSVTGQLSEEHSLRCEMLFLGLHRMQNWSSGENTSWWRAHTQNEWVIRSCRFIVASVQINTSLWQCHLQQCGRAVLFQCLFWFSSVCFKDAQQKRKSGKWFVYESRRDRGRWNEGELIVATKRGMSHVFLWRTRTGQVSTATCRLIGDERNILWVIKNPYWKHASLALVMHLWCLLGCFL